jgi:aminoglycoside 6'-N-acetyltransferase I
MIVREAEPADRAEWLRMLIGLYPESASESEHVPYVDAFLSGRSLDELLPEAVFVAVRDSGGLGGFLELSVRDYAEGCTGRAAYIESWYVDEDLRGTGVGRALMESAEEWARAHGHSEIGSDTLISNVRSQAAHQALGFEEVERSVHLRKSLPPRP